MYNDKRKVRRTTGERDSVDVVHNYGRPTFLYKTNWLRKGSIQITLNKRLWKCKKGKSFLKGKNTTSGTACKEYFA